MWMRFIGLYLKISDNGNESILGQVRLPSSHCLYMSQPDSNTRNRVLTGKNREAIHDRSVPVPRRDGPVGVT